MYRYKAATKQQRTEYPWSCTDITAGGGSKQE